MVGARLDWQNSHGICTITLTLTLTLDCKEIIGIATVMTPIDLWTRVLKRQVCILTVTMLVFWSQKVELTLVLAPSLVCMVHLQSMVNFDHTVNSQ